MHVVEIVKIQDLLSQPLQHFLRNGNGMMVKCENAQASKNVTAFMAAVCIHRSSGLEAPGGANVTIYEERSDVTAIEYIFMLPRDMKIATALHMYKNALASGLVRD